MAQARARGAAAGAAADVARLADVGGWLPASDLEARLAALAVDDALAPLTQAQAWWHLRSAARARMDRATAAQAEAALGLLNAWIARSGPAPHPTAPLSAAGWAPIPGPVLWLEAALRPAHNAQGTVATRLRHPTGGPAVLRLGYDDTATVRLNGDEVFNSDAAHDAWLDQAAIPVVLRPGDNTLVVQVGQTDGAWRLLARITDAQGTPLPDLTAHPDPWGPIPEPAEGDGPEPRDLWAELARVADAEPPVAQDLRDLADFARVTGLPDRELAVPRVAIEGAWAVDPSPRTLRAWLRALPDAERAALRSSKQPERPVTEADAYADRHLHLADGWRHYYGRRHAQTRAVLRRLLDEDPAWPPARRLEAVFLEDLGLPNRSAARLAAAQEARPDRLRLARAYAHALRSAGRITEAIAELHALVEADLAGPDVRYELADLRARRGETQEAVALLDEVIQARPERVTYALEAAAILARAGDHAAASARLEALHRRLPADPIVAEALARRYQAQGRLAEALPLVQQALSARPGDDGLLAWIEALTARPEAPRLGPPVAELRGIKAPKDAPAHVLYHHAQAQVGADGRAVRRVRRVVRILTDEGARRYGEWSLSYVPGQQRLSVEAARLIREGQPDASPQRRDQDLSEPEYRLYYDLRAKMLTFDRPQPGDLIEVAWTLADNAPDPSFPGYFGELAYLQEAAPRAQVVVEVTGPRADAVRFEVHAPGLAVTRAGARVEARDVPAIALEPHMPGASSLQAYVHVSTLAGWADVQDRYQALLGERTAPTPQLEALAKRWAGDAKGPEAIMAALYAKVADRTRYVGLEFGVRSFQPATPAETLARGFGDCKDKATLLIALAKALGVDAQIVLTRTRAAGAVAPEPASFALFDHAIVYVPALDRFMDPTVDRNGPWTLPPSDQGAQVFVVGGAPALRPVPPQPAAFNRAEWTVRGAVHPDGRLTGTLRLDLGGQPATQARRQLEGAAEPAAVLARLVAERFPGAVVEAPTLGGLRPALDPVTAEAPITVPTLSPAPGGGRAIPLRGGLVARYAQQATRKTPRQLPFKHTHTVALDLALPAGWRVRPRGPVDVASPFGRITVAVTDRDGRVQVIRTVAMDAFEVAPADYPAFRAWLGEADRALAAPLEVGP